MTAARRSRRGYHVSAAVPAHALVDEGFRSLGTHSALVGFDFPIGVPRAYAERAGITRFLDALPEFGGAAWPRFYEPCEFVQNVSPRRPFFPARAIRATKAEFAGTLGVAPADLLRECERATGSRSRACELFWTMGANQAGKAAITGWRDVLQPALARSEIRLWPFEGTLADLCADDRIVAAEVYPAEIYAHLALERNFGKRTQAGRASQADRILSWCSQQKVHLDPAAIADVHDGFGESAAGEDRFDSLIGVLGMIEAVQAPHREAWPQHIQEIEGWILGMRFTGR
ncbi:MAG: hypothetical protein JNL98_13885 [Bryobacterales bacterium]|nr:hypothetical protein [Bryobacterales bacterium]